jgi:aryl-alcohol dehydrogenase-like predicted oxidoreductase
VRRVLAALDICGRWLTGRYRKGRQAPASRCAELMPAQYDLSDPDNRHKLETAEALAVVAENAGMSLVHMALATLGR